MAHTTDPEVLGAIISKLELFRITILGLGGHYLLSQRMSSYQKMSNLIGHWNVLRWHVASSDGSVESQWAGVGAICGAKSLSLEPMKEVDPTDVSSFDYQGSEL